MRRICSGSCSRWDFITERQRTLQAAIEGLLIKQRLDLAPDVQDLDREIEEVELALRTLVHPILDGDPAQLPGHIVAKIDERLQGALKKNPAMDAEHYATLLGMLEYFDLRELEGTVVCKPLWPKFEGIFRTKEALAAKFNQLCDLRNAIRHSRTVDPVAKMEGKAAIVWFQILLSEDRRQ